MVYAYEDCKFEASLVYVKGWIQYGQQRETMSLKRWYIVPIR